MAAAQKVPWDQEAEVHVKPEAHLFSVALGSALYDNSNFFRVSLHFFLFVLDTLQAPIPT